MRTLLLALVLALAGAQRAVPLKPAANAPTSYEVTGITLNMPSTIFRPTGPRGANGAVLSGLVQWNLTIRYVDNLGTEYTDVHQDTTGAEKVAREVLAPASTPLKERLLQHLIAEGKIPPARITK